MNKPTCKICGKNFKVLDKSGLCAYCFKEENKFWSKDFSDKSEKNKGVRR